MCSSSFPELKTRSYYVSSWLFARELRQGGQYETIFTSYGIELEQSYKQNSVPTDMHEPKVMTKRVSLFWELA